MATTDLPRGLRNNNPGNIRHNRDFFKGEVTPSPDNAFKRFETMAYGYRAIFKMLRTYYNNYNLTTIRQWITRWAPPNENNTLAYITFVAGRAGISPDQELNLNDKNQQCTIVAAISRMENGLDANMGEVEAGWDLL